MVNKQTKRNLKKERKRMGRFLLIMFPVMILLASVLYLLAPSLKNQQWIVITLIVAFGLVGYFLYLKILQKHDEKQAKQPKKYDPFAD